MHRAVPVKAVLEHGTAGATRRSRTLHTLRTLLLCSTREAWCVLDGRMFAKARETVGERASVPAAGGPYATDSAVRRSSGMLRGGWSRAIRSRATRRQVLVCAVRAVRARPVLWPGGRVYKRLPQNFPDEQIVPASLLASLPTA
jgi:hypothetical protein